MHTHRDKHVYIFGGYLEGKKNKNQQKTAKKATKITLKIQKQKSIQLSA